MQTKEQSQLLLQSGAPSTTKQSTTERLSVKNQIQAISIPKSAKAATATSFYST